MLCGTSGPSLEKRSAAPALPEMAASGPKDEPLVVTASAVALPRSPIASCIDPSVHGMAPKKLTRVVNEVSAAEVPRSAGEVAYLILPVLQIPACRRSGSRIPTCRGGEPVARALPSASSIRIWD